MNDLVTHAPTPPPPILREEITVGRTRILSGTGAEVEVFTMTLAGETIPLLPLRNWSQLDIYKWRARGKVPGTPAGLEITFDHIKVAGEVVSNKDPAGAAKLQRLLNQWLMFARGTPGLTPEKAHAKEAAAAREAPARPEDLTPHFRVELDKEGQVHIKCLQGKETLAMIGLNLPGLNSLITQGLMHKPHALQVGALHDWVELDGDFFSFEKGNNDAAKLEKALNERYVSTAALGRGKEVVVFSNAASPTGFDIQFAAKVGGVIDHHKRPLNEESLGLLQDRERCGLLHKDLVIKLSPPNLIFKRKTEDGGEAYLNPGPDNIVTVIGDEGEQKTVNLSRPVSYLRLTALELTAVFNHPAINQHGTASSPASSAAEKPAPARVIAPPSPESRVELGAPAASPPAPPTGEAKPLAAPPPKPETVQPPAPPKPTAPEPSGAQPGARPTHVVRPLPNLWLKSILERPSIQQDWFTHLVYRQMAEHFGNSAEGYFGPIPCWACYLGDVEDLCDPAFRGVLLTQKGGLGYVNRGHLARFHREIAFVGTLESAIEAIGVKLLATALDAAGRIVFIVSEGYRAQFGLPEQTVFEELDRLRNHGAMLMSATEVLHSPEAIEVAWTVPAEQDNPDDPQAVEHLRPNLGAADAIPPKEPD